ncbi:MAG TPA: twin-arginine translocase subunit TatC [Candidatus Saccharimonadales bacterium]|nr:twin-arginine translocase subunit TatC [Candidatus Saccharimonadales bacterium]
MQKTLGHKTAKQRATKRHNEPDLPPVKSFSDHISELRRRLFAVVFIFIAASGIAYNYNEIIVKAIMKPLGGEKLIYLTPGGGFNFIFQVSLYAGLLLAAPVLIHQLYGFIKPALPDRAKRSASKVVVAAFVLMLAGVAFGYFIAIPSALHFLSTFAGSDIIPNLTADSYLNFFLAYVAGLGVLFELPLLLLFFHWIHPLTPSGLLKTERFVILFSFVVAAIITPTPDMFNQAMIAVPLILIYQLGAITVWVAIRKEHKKLLSTRQQKSTEKTPREPEVSLQKSPQPLSLPQAPVAPSTVPPVRPRRSLDGFGPSQRRVSVPQRAQAPQRGSGTPRSHYQRGLSVDGFIS